MTSIWFPNNKYHASTKNYLQCLLLGGDVRGKGLMNEIVLDSAAWRLFHLFLAKQDLAGLRGTRFQPE